MALIRIVTEGRPVELSCVDEGQGQPVVLIHGFASTKEVNWINTGWMKALLGVGFRVICFDNRGHGESTKFHAKSDYTLDIMARDTLGLINALQLKRPHIVGYSMGARIASMLAIEHGADIGRVVLSGNGWGMVEGSGDWTVVEQALLAPSLADVTDERGRTFRKFADQTKSDRMALAACVSGVRQLVPREGLASIENGVLVAIGTEDDLAGSGEKLADVLPNAQFFPIKGRDHMRAVGDRSHIAAALEFLSA